MDIRYISLGHPDTNGTFILQRGGCHRPTLCLHTEPHPDSDIIRLRQIHSKRVSLAPEQCSPDLPGDGLVTDRRGISLSVTVADCLPIYLYVEDADVYGIVHSGWKGTGIVNVAVDRMCTLTDRPRCAFRAVIGPGIGACCYAVEPSRAALFPPSCSVQRNGRRFLDLKRVNLELLEASGIGSARVVDTCTSCDLRMHSYRREGARRFEKMAAVIGFDEI